MNQYKLRYQTGGKTLEIAFDAQGKFEFEHFTVTAEIVGARRTVSVTAKADVTLIKCTQRAVATASFNDVCLINGYQSWTKTKEYFLSEEERDVKRLPKPLIRAYAFDRYGDATFFDYDKNLLHGYDLFYSKGSKQNFLFNLNYKTAYLVFIVDKTSAQVSISNELMGLKLSAGQSAVVSDFVAVPDYKAGLKAFDEYFPKKKREKMLGYTSWYNYYQNVNEQIILSDLNALDDRFDLFQIDDGYEAFVGDWMDVDKVKFPNGLKGIVDKIHQRGFKAGIWLAPFVAEQKSKVFAEHPEWFSFNGERVKCGSNWSGFYAINLHVPEAVEYVQKCLGYYMDLGFDFFKLDFLYAVSLPAYDGQTRSMVAEKAYDMLRKTLKDKIILGCGATLFNAINKFDYMRIGPDVSLIFDDVWFMRFMHNERISTKVTLQNTVYRYIFSERFFGNDPDVFLLRDDNIKLSKQQKRALVTLNALFGNLMMTSDNIARYDEQKKAALSEALDLYENAAVTGYEREHDLIRIDYEIRGEKKRITYNTKKGVLL